MKFLYTLFLSVACFCLSHAQLTFDCDGRDAHSVYMIVGSSGFYRIDSVDTNPTEPIKVAPDTNDAEGISINRRLDIHNGPLVMYASGGSPRTYSYWNGTTWVETGHSTGSVYAINHGGTNDYLFNLDGRNGKVYKYDGSGNSTLLLSNLPTENISIYDIATDKQGNFYVFYTQQQRVVIYNPDGIAMDTLTTTGNPGNLMAGFAILGKRMYTLNATTIYEGILTGKTIAFTDIKTLPDTLLPGDIAACPEAGEVLAGFSDPASPHFALYPNPATGSTVLKLDNAARIEVVDGLGRRIESIEVMGLREHRLLLNGWLPGIYYVSVISPGGEVAYTKLVVQ